VLSVRSDRRAVAWPILFATLVPTLVVALTVFFIMRNEVTNLQTNLNQAHRQIDEERRAAMEAKDAFASAQAERLEYKQRVADLASVLSNRGPRKNQINGEANAAFVADELGHFFQFYCPSGEPARDIWGSGIYGAASSICTAAVHDGRITKEVGGLVTIKIGPEKLDFEGRLRNGIMSKSGPGPAKTFSFVD
jgi:hypothetical protein